MRPRLHWILCLASLLACTPEIPDGVLVCSPDVRDVQECPSGFACQADMRCHREPVPSDAGARAAVDAATDPATGGAIRDAGTPDAGSVRDAGADTRVTCRTPDAGIVCDDQRFCNGQETCQPGAADADARGCLPGNRMICGDGQLCSDSLRACTTCSSGPNDADADRHDAAACGGDDCDDDDSTRYPGAVEACNGKDDDCDGTIDGPAAACVDVDECAAGAHDCSPLATCRNTLIGFACSCPAGWSGSGRGPLGCGKPGCDRPHPPPKCFKP